jgi:isopentenyl phosphate kinase
MGGFVVCSSDAIAARLAVELHARRLFFATDVPGIMRRTERGEVLLAEVGELEAAAVDASDNDATGGMRGKVIAGLAAARAGTSTLVLDGRVPGRLLGALKGQDVPGTRLAWPNPGQS